MPKRELKSNLEDFDMKSYLGKNRSAAVKREETIERTDTAEAADFELTEAGREAIEENRRIKTDEGSDVASSSGGRDGGEAEIRSSVIGQKNKSVTEAATKPSREKQPAVAAAQEKIAFMNYLPPEIHIAFSRLFIEARSEVRTRTRKALSQTELVEAIIRYCNENWDARKESILNIAEEIVVNRRGKE